MATPVSFQEALWSLNITRKRQFNKQFGLVQFQTELVEEGSSDADVRQQTCGCKLDRVREVGALEQCDVDLCLSNRADSGGLVRVCLGRVGQLADEHFACERTGCSYYRYLLRRRHSDVESK